ncbi:hypothetical protein HZS_3243 [Henneguya salminicola]|nr:hypothetical protein HZS_3243 [Henneguya salminicola]
MSLFFFDYLTSNASKDFLLKQNIYQGHPKLVGNTVSSEILQVNQLKAWPNFGGCTQSNVEFCPMYEIVKGFSYEYQSHY